MQTSEDVATVEGGNGAAAAGAGLAGIPVYVLMKRWQAKQGEKQAAELVATPPAPVRSPVEEGAAVAMKGSR